MMLLVSLAVLSLVFPARAEIPALFTGTWHLTGMPRQNGQWLHDEFTQNANGDYTGKGWGNWDGLTSGTNNYTYSGITSDGVCETDATTGAVTFRSEWTMIQNYDVGANPEPTWSTPSWRKWVWCGYNTYDTTTDIMTVTNYRSNETTALNVDPGACPATAAEAAAGLSWAPETFGGDPLPYKCVADCNPWACDETASPASPSDDDESEPIVLLDDDESAAVSTDRAERSLVPTLVAGLLGAFGLL